jgi:hypothetical protein
MNDAGNNRCREDQRTKCLPESATKNECLQLGKIRNLDCPGDWMLRRCLYHEYSVRTWKTKAVAVRSLIWSRAPPTFRWAALLLGHSVEIDGNTR